MASTEYSAPETTPVWLQKLFTEVFTIITPAGFEHMFRALGEPYTGLIWSDADLERVTEKLNSGVANAMTEFDVIPMQSTSSAVLGGTVVRPYVAEAKSGDIYSLTTLEVFNKSGSVWWNSVPRCRLLLLCV
ncbi:uncharacterized protein FFB14_12520 [Fusarium fujikuroi]|nr:uncharacterized protein FFB14_12520 [Fusarium fujikuroi]